MPYKTDIANAEARRTQAENDLRNFDAAPKNPNGDIVEILSERCRLRDLCIQAQLDLIRLQTRQIEELRARVALETFGGNHKKTE